MRAVLAAMVVVASGCATVGAVANGEDANGERAGFYAEAQADDARGAGPVVLTVANHYPTDLCGLYLWSDADPVRQSDNRLLPGTVLVGANSPYRLTPGTWRDLVLSRRLDETSHLEVRDCQGRVVAAWHRGVLQQHEGVFQVASR